MLRDGWNTELAVQQLRRRSPRWQGVVAADRGRWCWDPSPKGGVRGNSDGIKTTFNI